MWITKSQFCIRRWALFTGREESVLKLRKQKAVKCLYFHPTLANLSAGTCKSGWNIYFDGLGIAAKLKLWSPRIFLWLTASTNKLQTQTEHRCKQKPACQAPCTVQIDTKQTPQRKRSFCTTPCTLFTYIQTHKQNHLFPFAFLALESMGIYPHQTVYNDALGLAACPLWLFSWSRETFAQSTPGVTFIPQTYWNILMQTLNQNTKINDHC